MQQIYQDQVARVKIRAFKEIFVHYDDEENLLGIHRWGSRFYKGEFKQRQIAIKRSLKTTMPVNEIWNLGKIDAHPNVVRYIAMEASADAFYVGLELCKFNLEQLITDVTLREARSQITIKSIMYQTTSGLSHLHELNISRC